MEKTLKTRKGSRNYLNLRKRKALTTTIICGILYGWRGRVGIHFSTRARKAIVFALACAHRRGCIVFILRLHTTAQSAPVQISNKINDLGYPPQIRPVYPDFTKKFKKNLDKRLWLWYNGRGLNANENHYHLGIKKTRQSYWRVFGGWFLAYKL